MSVYLYTMPWGDWFKTSDPKSMGLSHQPDLDAVARLELCEEYTDHEGSTWERIE